MPQYIVPPSYRAGQGNRAVSNVKDALTLMDFLVKIKQADVADTVDTAELYIKEGIQSRRDKKLQQYDKDMKDYSHRLDMERLSEQVDIQKAEEKRRYGEGGYDEKAASLRHNLTRDANREEHNKNYLAAYDTEDLSYDDGGWATVKKGAVSRDEKSKSIDNVLKMSGIQVPYSQDPNSKMQSLYSVFRKGQTMAHPSVDVRTQDGELGVFYKDTNVRDATPGAFSGQGDITAALQELEKFRDRVGGSESEINAIDNMFMAGISSPNPLFMKPQDYQTYQKNQAAMERGKTTGLTSKLALETALSTAQQAEVKAADDVAESAHVQFIVNTSQKSGDDDALVLSSNTSELYNKMIEKINRNELDPHVSEGARMLFGMGKTPVDPGEQPVLMKETSYDFFAKFKYLDKEGRGGSPSIAYQALNEMGLGKQYPIFKSIVDGTNPRVQKNGEKGIGYDFLMHDINSIHAQLEQANPQNYRIDYLDQHFRNSPFVATLDDLEATNDLEYSYENGKLSIIFNSEKDLKEFWLFSLEKYPDAIEMYEHLAALGKMEIEINE